MVKKVIWLDIGLLYCIQHTRALSSHIPSHPSNIWTSYRISGNFCIKNNSCEKISSYSIFAVLFREILTVDDCNMDERLESSWCLVYYQVSGEPGIAGCSRRSDIYFGECGLARASLFTDHHRHNFIFRVLNFPVFASTCSKHK